MKKAVGRQGERQTAHVLYLDEVVPGSAVGFLRVFPRVHYDSS